jgi:peptidoglycan/LPS O-acetylase OafA/YrhL
VWIPASFAQLRSLTGLRFAAAFAVFGFHFQAYTGGDAHRIFNDLFRWGGVGVEFFFILSGAVLTWSARPDDTPRAFYRRRVARIVPIYLLAWAATFILEPHPRAVGQFGPMIASLFLVQSWIPDVKYVLGWNSVAWTLSCEAFFYAAFPLLISRLRRIDRPARLIPWLLAPHLIFAIGRAASSVPANLQFNAWSYLDQAFPPTHLCEFIAGICIALELQRGTLRRIPRWAAWGSLAVADFIEVAWDAKGAFVLFTFLAPMIMLVASYAYWDVNPQGRGFWSSTPLIRLGQWSYAFYLFHQLALREWSNHHVGLVGIFRSTAWFGLLALMAVALSAAIFYVVERPAERSLRGSPVPTAR